MGEKYLSNRITRREFIQLTGLATMGLGLNACGGAPTPVEPRPSNTHTATLMPSQTPAPTDTPQPTPTNTATAQPAKLPETLRQAGERIGFRIGNTFYSDDIGAYRPAYKEQSIKHFSAIWSANEFYDDAIKQYGDEGIRRVLEIADDGDQELIVNGFFYRVKIPSELQELPDDASLKDKVEANMRERLQYVFPYLRNRKRMTYFVGNHETIDIYQGERLWDPTDIWYRAFGEDVFIRTGEIMFEEAEKAGLKPGVDIIFMIGLTDMLFPGPMLEFGMEVFTRAKSILAELWNIPYAQVPLGIVAEGHATQTGTVRGHFQRPALDQMIPAMTRMAKEGPVYLTEVEIQNATAAEAASYLSEIAIAGHQAGIAGATLWAAIRNCIDQPEPGWCNPEGALFDQQGTPTQVYQTLLATLNSLGA